MTILAVDDNPEALKELTEKLQEVFPEEQISAFGGSLLALQYVSRHPKEVALAFSAMVMQQMDGIEFAKSLRVYSPATAMFIIVQTESAELAAIAKQHGNGTCLTRPVTAESIRQATSFLQEPCPWEDENCEEGCLWEWCSRKQKISV